MEDNKLLIEALRQDDLQAFDRLYDIYWKKLYLSAYNLLRNKEVCEDIVQEIFLQLWQKRHTQEIDNLQSYLHTATRFRVFKAIRDGKARTDLQDEAEQIPSNSNASDRLIENELQNKLEEGIKILPEKCRMIFIMSRQQHLSTQEIADRLNLSPKTVENQLTIALRKLKKHMGELMFWATIILSTVMKR